jgi:hypothetical protein
MLSSPCRPMQFLGVVVQVSALSVLETGKEVTLGEP